MHFDRLTQLIWNVQLNIYLQILFVFIELCPNSMTRKDESFNYVLYCTSFYHLSFIFSCYKYAKFMRRLFVYVIHLLCLTDNFHVET